MHGKSFLYGLLTGAAVTLVAVVALAALGFVTARSVPSVGLAGSDWTIPDGVPDDGSRDGDAAIAELLTPIRLKHAVPAICAAVVNGQGVVAIGAVGVRKVGDATAVTVEDRWHLGSNTKAMTATLIGRLVEQGKIRWASTLGEIYPELVSSMLPEMKDVTVTQLLAHRSGLTANYNWHDLSRHGTLPQQRYAVVKKAVTETPEFAVGQEYHYSNTGYVVAGAMVEKIAGTSWEDQITALLFEPLGMTTAGFGGVGTRGQIDQPWGHHDNGKPAAFNGPKMDNPLLIAPAGCVHSTMADWAKFVIDQLNGATGKPGLLTPQTYQAIRTPPFGDDYALGWGVHQREWGGGTVLSHGGSNTMNYANVWIAPKRDFAVLVCVNQGGDAGFMASDEAVGALIDAYIKNPVEP